MQRTENSSEPMAINLEGVARDLHKVKQLQEEKIQLHSATEKLPYLQEKFVSLHTKRIMQTIRELADANPNIKRMSEKEMIEDGMRRDRKNQMYAAKLKFCNRIYSNLNEKLLEQINTLKVLNASAQEDIKAFKVTNEEIYQLEGKIKRYDSEITKLEKKYPWLKNSELKLTSIMDEVHKLDDLRQKHKELNTQLDCYKGLSSDLAEARHKLIAVKDQYEKLK